MLVHTVCRNLVRFEYAISMFSGHGHPRIATGHGGVQDLLEKFGGFGISGFEVKGYGTSASSVSSGVLL